MTDTSKVVLFDEERAAKLAQLIADGQEAERILRSPLWSKLFHGIREAFVQELVNTESTQINSILSVQAKIKALDALQANLQNLFRRAKEESKRPARRFRRQQQLCLPVRARPAGHFRNLGCQADA